MLLTNFDFDEQFVEVKPAIFKCSNWLRESLDVMLVIFHNFVNQKAPCIGGKEARL